LSTDGEHIERLCYLGLRGNRAQSRSRQPAHMFDDRVGSILRALRIRRGLRQSDVARLASVSDTTVSRLERGQLETLSVAVIRRVARVLEVRMDFAPWSRRGDLHRFATAEHAALVEYIVRRLESLGWIARAEVSFSHAGERGFVDILAWHAATRTVLVIEVKTEIVDIGEALGTFDRKRRLAPTIARGLGWDVASLGAALIVQDTRTNRRRVAAHRATIGTQLPQDGRRLGGYLHRPGGSVAAVAFWTNNHPGTLRPTKPGSRRVRRANSCSIRPLRAR
jgi:transcriptional regulator with XRE-family HTH domain